MAETTGISWADRTWSPWTGCTRVSPACDGCYAAHLMDTRMGRVAWGAPGAGEGTRDRMSAAYWRKPLAWDREAAAAGNRPFVFPSLCDPFDNAVPPAWRRDFFDLIRATPHLVWLLLTKRPAMIERMVAEAGGLPANAALGCTVVNDAEARRDVWRVLAAKRALRPLFAFVSLEPLVEAVRLPGLHAVGEPGGEDINMPALDWVITGGETDQGAHKARPSHPRWFRDLRDQCAAAGVRFHHKQNGEWAPGEIVCGSGAGGVVPVAWGDEGGWSFGSENLAAEDGHVDDEPTVYRIGKAKAGRMLDGVIHDERPQVAA